MLRRNFIKTAAAAGAGILAGNALRSESVPAGDLYSLSDSLLREWCEGLMRLQVGRGNGADSGGIMCPACGIIHGRCGDAFYPLLYLADRDGDSRFTDSALALFDWQELNVSRPDGSWLNESSGNSWKGITVFGAIALGEALKRHGRVLSDMDRLRVSNRFRKAADFIMGTFSFSYGNINYPISAAHALALAGELLGDSKYSERAKFFGRGALKYITSKDKFIYGEGHPHDAVSPKGCRPVDLGYNVEESLPSLVHYALISKDSEVLEAAIESMRSHMEFMLPDGAWDNGWGTRSAKWTYWGSRTSDGCQGAYGLLFDRDERFYAAALKNARLLAECTHGGLLYGGPHCFSHKVPPCVHHTFSHAKALAGMLDARLPVPRDADKIRLPRESQGGAKFFGDIATLLVSKGPFRATVTGYDFDYVKDGHASGGALSMLWHERAGAIFAASMGTYERVEKTNMQPDTDPNSMALTARVEFEEGGVKYRNINDFSAKISSEEVGGRTIVRTASRLVSREQKSPPSGEIPCLATYEFSPDRVVLSFDCAAPSASRAKIILPVISQSGESCGIDAGGAFWVKRKNCGLKVSCDRPLARFPASGERIFNFVPGFEAAVLEIASGKAEISVEAV